MDRGTSTCGKLVAHIAFVYMKANIDSVKTSGTPGFQHVTLLQVHQQDMQSHYTCFVQCVVLSKGFSHHLPVELLQACYGGSQNTVLARLHRSPNGLP